MIYELGDIEDVIHVDFMGMKPIFGSITKARRGCFRFGALLIYARATVAGDNTMQRRRCKKNQQGQKTTPCPGERLAKGYSGKTGNFN